MGEYLTADVLSAAIASMTAEDEAKKAPEGNLTKNNGHASQPSSKFAEGDDRETVRAALQVIDPDVDYQTWLSVLMGAHSVDSSGSMLELVDRWSRGGVKYKDGEVSVKWASFEPSGGTTVATIAHLADQTGQTWRTSRPKPTNNGHPTSQQMLSQMGADLRSRGLTHRAIAAALMETNNEQCKPPLNHHEIERITELVCRSEPGQIATASVAATAAETLILKRMSDVEEQEINALWPNRFFRGKFNQLQGDPGLGKTMVICDITARVSIGADWPDGSRNDGPGSVIIITSEDDPADTLKPRLRRAGADMTKIHVLETAMTVDPKTGKLVRESFDIGRHVPLLINAIEQIGDVVLIVIDPISAYTGKVDSHRNAEVRSMLVDFLAMIARLNICLLGIIHQNKQMGGKSVYRASGSLAFTAAARSVWMIARDHEDEARRLMLPVKCNIAARLDGLAYRIESDGGGPPFVHWEAAPVALSADGYLQQEENSSRKNEANSALAKAVEFLQGQLKDGPVPSKDLEDAVRGNYIAPATYKRARESLNCRAEKIGKVWWTLLPGQKLPAGLAQESQHPRTDKHDALDTLDTHDPLKEETQEYQ